MSLRRIEGINKQFFQWVKEDPKTGWIKTYNDVDYYMCQEGDTVYIKFQQTISKIDWGRNFLFFPKLIAHRCDKNKDGFLSWLHLIWFSHCGFHDGWKSCHYDILKTILNNNKNSGINRIVFTGYSQGAGIALEGYREFKESFFDSNNIQIECYAFAPPRIVFSLFSWNVRKFLEKANLIIARGDIVTNSPPWLFGFLHIGKKYRFGRWQPWPTPACHEPFYYEAILPNKIKE